MSPVSVANSDPILISIWPNRLCQSTFWEIVVKRLNINGTYLYFHPSVRLNDSNVENKNSRLFIDFHNFYNLNIRMECLILITTALKMYSTK